MNGSCFRSNMQTLEVLNHLLFNNLCHKFVLVKRIFCILFCFIYFVSSAGIHFNLHYCGGKVKSISLRHTDEEGCCGSKMKKKDCCKEKTFSYKVKDNQNSTTKTILVKSANSGPHIDLQFPSPIFIYEVSSLSVGNLDDPPDIPYNNTYLLNRAFRI